ncbi:Mov34-domain-containing protein [Butyriboletus roseoflavus]|nr:Mov34-domain-containing protein [Butyriboletus roseoflavus]
MPLGPSSSAIFIQNASHSPTDVNRTASSALFLAHVHPPPATSASSPSVVNVTHAFAVLHSETEEQVAVDGDYHRAMYEMFLKGRGESIAPPGTASAGAGVGPQGREGLSIVGWYATGSSEGGQAGLGTFSALIQNFYEQETAPFPAVHVALDTGTEEGVGAGVRAYVSSPVGVYSKPENCVFVPIPCELKFHESERSGLDLLLSSSTSSNTLLPTSPLPAIHTALVSTSDALSRVLAHVQAILRGEIPPDPALGKYLWNVLGAAPDEEGGWATALQDSVMVSYLANLVRGQAEVAARLALAGGA